MSDAMTGDTGNSTNFFYLKGIIYKSMRSIYKKPTKAVKINAFNPHTHKHTHQPTNQIPKTKQKRETVWKKTSDQIMNLSNRNVKQKEQNEANAVASHVQAKLNCKGQQKLSIQAWNISLAKCPELQCLHRRETHQFTFNDKPKVWKGFYRWSNQRTEMKSELGWTRIFF